MRCIAPRSRLCCAISVSCEPSREHSSCDVHVNSRWMIPGFHPPLMLGFNPTACNARQFGISTAYPYCPAWDAPPILPVLLIKIMLRPPFRISGSLSLQERFQALPPLSGDLQLNQVSSRRLHIYAFTFKQLAPQNTLYQL